MQCRWPCALDTPPLVAEVRIPHRITDTPSEDDMRRLTKFYSETFWANIKVFVCHQARLRWIHCLQVSRLDLRLPAGAVAS